MVQILSVAIQEIWMSFINPCHLWQLERNAGLVLFLMDFCSSLAYKVERGGVRCREGRQLAGELSCLVQLWMAALTTGQMWGHSCPQHRGLVTACFENVVGFSSSSSPGARFYYSYWTPASTVNPPSSLRNFSGLRILEEPTGPPFCVSNGALDTQKEMSTVGGHCMPIHPLLRI